jgi:hypothetical protein
MGRAMKRLAGMQPYFFPYIGYWQLIRAADCFVLFDEAQYVKQGWINRNRVLKPGGGWQYIVAPVKGHPMSARIRDVGIFTGSDWRTLIVRRLAHYRKIAPHFEETEAVVADIFSGADESSIGAFNCAAIRKLCVYLGIDAEIIVSSERNFDYANVAAPGDWALAHSEQLGASEFLNPVGGAHLFDREKFLARGIGLSFLHCGQTPYAQPGPFEPSLSIIDVLMFNGIEGTKRRLDEFRIEGSDA